MNFAFLLQQQISLTSFSPGLIKPLKIVKPLSIALFIRISTSFNCLSLNFREIRSETILLLSSNKEAFPTPFQYSLGASRDELSGSLIQSVAGRFFINSHFAGL